MSDPLIKSAAIHGSHLVGLDGVRLGAVRETFLNLETGAIGFLIVEVSGLLGGSGKFQPVPWSAVRFDAVASHFVIAVDKAAYKAAPSYDRDQLSNAAYGWQEQSSRYFADLLGEGGPTVGG